jgi:hypothetical protein
MIAAKAAKMKCVIVPATEHYASEKWGAADAKISSLSAFTDQQLHEL